MASPRRSIKLPQAGWDALAIIAIRLGCFYRGMPSWRVLVRRVSEGELRITFKDLKDDL